MATEHETGGPAFPVVYPDGSGVDRGMTLRDYFAAKAMVALLTETHRIVSECGCTKYQRLYDVDDPEQAGTVAFLSYRMADAMIQARST